MSQQFSGQLGLRQVQGEVQKGSGKCWIFLPLRSESPCFFLRKWILSKETDSEDLHWSFFHDRLGSLTLKIMWRIFCLACCCPGEACFSNAFTSVSAQAGTSKKSSLKATNDRNEMITSTSHGFGENVSSFSCITYITEFHTEPCQDHQEWMGTLNRQDLSSVQRWNCQLNHQIASNR